MNQAIGNWAEGRKHHQVTSLLQPPYYPADTLCVCRDPGFRGKGPWLSSELSRLRSLPGSFPQWMSAVCSSSLCSGQGLVCYSRNRTSITPVCVQQDGQQFPGEHEWGGEWQLYLQFQDVHQLGLPHREFRDSRQQICLHHHQLQGSHPEQLPLAGQSLGPPSSWRVLPTEAEGKISPQSVARIYFFKF